MSQFDRFDFSDELQRKLIAEIVRQPAMFSALVRKLDSRFWTTVIGSSTMRALRAYWETHGKVPSLEYLRKTVTAANAKSNDLHVDNAKVATYFDLLETVDSSAEADSLKALATEAIRGKAEYLKEQKAQRIGA